MGARVDVAAQQAVVVEDTLARQVRRSGRSDVQGRFVVCGAALDQPISFRASNDGYGGENGIARWTSDIMVLTIVLRPGAP